jgi:hypothetical protein
MRYFRRSSILVLFFLSQASAQDPLKVLPHAYKLQLENDWVRVVRVRYGPKEKLVAHEHTPTASAYVYLNDSGPVVFNHIDKDYGAVTRPATKTGTFRVYRGLHELHEVENKSALPSEFLKVEFKTDPVNDKSLRGRFPRESYPAGENFQKVQFENEQVRITRLVCVQKRDMAISTSATEPALIIALTPSRLKIAGGSNTSSVTLELGQTTWLSPDYRAEVENRGTDHMEFLRFDFKTKPMPKEALEKLMKHQHPKK